MKRNCTLERTRSGSVGLRRVSSGVVFAANYFAHSAPRVASRSRTL